MSALKAGTEGLRDTSHIRSSCCYRPAGVMAAAELEPDGAEKGGTSFVSAVSVQYTVLGCFNGLFPQ